ncbi:ABC transporter permease subunit [Luteipulveratus flavus]|uniref:ABC transporter permease subunit n=1 Tax=Luteipulveratus flavus TaxID=3031728 RepID=A0ABT6C896_9MICO|nr:ABC transporter permease subunit [Luteipulveratus sp. YIM 133296]MDF8265095.1 ABC transporter permease subunit [Luteipulveratus sp. YIM 133296]
MGAAIRSELRKIFTTRLWWGMAIPIVLLAAGVTALLAATSEPEKANPDLGVPAMSQTQFAINTYTGAVGLGYLLTMCVGIVAIGSEYRHQTITSTFLAVPHRTRVMAAKVVALLVTGAFYGLLFVVAAVAAGAAVLSSRGLSTFGEGFAVPRALLLMLLVLGLWALIGLGAGILIPNQVAALMIMVGIAWILEPILGGVLASQDWGEGVSKFFPSRATQAMLSQQSTGINDSVPVERLSWPAGALVLLAYSALLAGIGTWLTTRRDVS